MARNGRGPERSDPQWTLVRPQLVAIARSRFLKGLAAARAHRDPTLAARELHSLAGWAVAFGLPKIASAARRAASVLEGSSEDGTRVDRTGYEGLLDVLEQRIENLEPSQCESESS